jgi:thiosulfate/3-mercaptopyruvate sulfurtransferase
VENLVSTDWLDAHLDDPDLIVLDCTNFAELTADGCRYITTSGRKNWENEHISSSGYADFTAGLASDNVLYRNSLPTPERFGATMGRLGVGDGRRVVLYDSGKSMWAARVWWMLRWVGFDNAAVLDGGWQLWNAEGRRTSSMPPLHTPVDMRLHHRPDLFVSKETLMSVLDAGTTRIIDGLSTLQFNGTGNDLGLSGHIPGAHNIPATSLIDPETGLFLPLEQLAEFFQDDRSTPTIIYCGSGIAAASIAFVMARLGCDAVAIYMPGLQEWAQDPDAPLVNRWNGDEICA